MAAAWPERWATAAAARDWRARSGGMKLDGNSAPFRYQHTGRAQKWHAGAYHPAIMPDPRAWLEGRLSCQLADFEICEAAEEADPQPAATAAPPPFMPAGPVVVTNPAAKAAALAATLGRWLDLMAHARPSDVHFRAPLSPAAASFF